MIHAHARFVDSNTVQLFAIDGAKAKPPAKYLRYEKCILASGSRPAIPGPLRVDDPRVMDSTGALELADMPGSLLVIGGGYIGLEMGTVYRALGSKVVVVELTGSLLPGVDGDLVRPLQNHLKTHFEAIHLNTKVEALEPRENGILARLKGDGVEPEMLFDRVLVSVGRWPNSGGLGLESTRIRLNERGFVLADARQQTDDPSILAIGDVAGEPMLAHKAAREAAVAVETAAGAKAEFDNAAIPAVVFTDPEIAWCGLTETQARAEKIKVEVTRFPWAASGRAMSLGRTDGMTKILFDPETERVLGVGIVGSGAGELIAEGVLAVEMAAVARDVAESIHPHPTLSETVMESAEAFLGAATHMYRPRKK
ncbi:MAG: Dihydrolipoyl dehydrogenase [candidate division BRC1 bacterium ADurb.BinA364]|nr:MAG: Dihydrolipoyl dehydrogenase [candidate division BRC1 bacterium ADurb.BinA364]